MQCELCSHEVEEEMIEVLMLKEQFGRGEQFFWACPDCVDYYKRQEEKEKNQESDLTN